MCYSVVTSTRKQIQYAKHRNDDPEIIKLLQEKLKHLEQELRPNFVANGFAHPRLLVFTDSEPFEPKALSWGLIPFWVKDIKTALQIRNQTLNARRETLFEKPAFRNSAKNKRCLIVIDAFYEHHHLNGKAYPFHIAMQSGSPITLAGLWDEWVNPETGEMSKTVSIITTEANAFMKIIHNNPKEDGSRMPVILPKAIQDEWLIPARTESETSKLNALLKPYETDELVAHTVHRLSGKESIGNIPEAELEYNYKELEGINFNQDNSIENYK
jgi:putative SOS response-associated peptidase YedK